MKPGAGKPRGMVAAVAGALLCLSGSAAAEPAVAFLLTDAMVKGKRLSGVEVLVTQGAGAERVATGRTDGNGVLRFRLQPGRYKVTYRLSGYIPLERRPIRVRRKGRLITTALTPLLEVSGQHGRTRVQFVLSWDSGKGEELNADAHVYRPDLKPRLHLHWRRRAYKGEGSFKAELDQDAKGGGGPETITLLDPPAGRYAFFVHAPRSAKGALRENNARARITLDDALLAEFVIPESCAGQVWRPFHHLLVEAGGKVEVVGRLMGDTWRCDFPQASELTPGAQPKPVQAEEPEKPLPAEAPAREQAPEGDNDQQGCAVAAQPQGRY